MIFFTADEHYGHSNIIKYCNRPFRNINEMNTALIDNHNSKVSQEDRVIHVGDFTLNNRKYAQEIIRQLNGTHTFILGSHDRWMNNKGTHIWKGKIDDVLIVACHYAMRVWPQSHFGSWQVYGHSHGNLPSQGKQWDVGVDNNNFEPVSFAELRIIMSLLDDNINQLK